MQGKKIMKLKKQKNKLNMKNLLYVSEAQTKKPFSGYRCNTHNLV